MKPRLEALAKDYFNQSAGLPGTPGTSPQGVVVRMSDSSDSAIVGGSFDQITAYLSINSAGLDAFLNAPPQHLILSGHPRLLHHAWLLEGFEKHPPQKKVAAFYVQSWLQEASGVQEGTVRKAFTSRIMGLLRKTRRRERWKSRSTRGIHVSAISCRMARWRLHSAATP